MANSDKMNFFKRRYEIIEDLLDTQILIVNKNYTVENLLNYRALVEYGVLEKLSHEQENVVNDLDEYYNFMKLFRNKINNAYYRYVKNNYNPNKKHRK